MNKQKKRIQTLRTIYEGVLFDRFDEEDRIAFV